MAGFRQSQGDSASRLRGYVNSLAQHNIPYDSKMVVFGQHAYGTSYQAAKQLIDSGSSFTAVLASSDEAAIATVDALRDAGLSVPHDIAVIGFDDRLEARAQIPLLTTVHLPMFELGYRSAELLYRIIHGIEAPDSVVQIPTHLVIRESCGCLPGASGPVISAQSDNQGIALPTPFRVEGGPALPDHGRQVQQSVAVKTVSQNGSQSSIHIAQAMAELVHKEMRRLSKREVEYLCYRLVDAFKMSLSHGNATTFRTGIQQILEHVSLLNDDLYALQSAITILKEKTPLLLQTVPYSLAPEQIDNMLHQARIAISEVSRGQYARLLLRQINQANEIGQMTSWFFTAQSETEIFEAFNRCMPALGIQDAAVAVYHQEEEDLVGKSILKTPRLVSNGEQTFPTRHFPPPGLYSDEQPVPISHLTAARGRNAYRFCGISHQRSGATRHDCAAVDGRIAQREFIQRRSNRPQVGGRGQAAGGRSQPIEEPIPFGRQS
jgi:hypothetical protein